MPANFTTPCMETAEGTVGEKNPVGLGTYGTAKSGNESSIDVTKGAHLTNSSANVEATGNYGGMDVAGPL